MPKKGYTCKIIRKDVINDLVLLDYLHLHDISLLRQM